MARPTLVARGDARRSPIAVALLALALLQGACAARASTRCPRGEFLYTERTAGPGQTLEEHPVYACAARPDSSRR